MASRKDVWTAMAVGGGLTGAIYAHSAPLFLASVAVFAVYLWGILFGKGPRAS